MGMNEFKESFSHFHGIILRNLRQKYPDFPEESFNWIARMTEYCVPGGKCIRGGMVVEAVSEAGADYSVLKKAQCAGWCIEWLQAYFLVADDVMDGSLMRRGRECWFRRPEVGLIAVNDALLLRSSVDLLLEEHFQDNQQQLSQLLSLFRDIERDTQMGQLLDLTMNWRGNPSLRAYYQMVQHKTALYTFYLPYACAHIISNQAEPITKLVRDICLQLGTLFQVQDDVLDAFGDPGAMGKIGNDIGEGKCTWLLCKLLEKTENGHRLTSEESKTLQTCYGTVEGTGAIKSLYEKYQLKGDFDALEAERSLKIRQNIQLLPSTWSQSILQSYLHRIVKRIK